MTDTIRWMRSHKLGTAGIVLGVVVLPLVLILWAGGIKWLTAPFTGAVEQRTITTRGAYRIQAYEQFYRWNEQIAAIDAKLGAYEPPMDRRMRTECVGLQSQRANLVARYNAASRQIETQGQWMAEDLPIQLAQPKSNPCG